MGAHCLNTVIEERADVLLECLRFIQDGCSALPFMFVPGRACKSQAGLGALGLERVWEVLGVGNNYASVSPELKHPFLSLLIHKAPPSGYLPVNNCWQEGLPLI